MPKYLESMLRKNAEKTWRKKRKSLIKKWGKKSTFIDAYVFGTLRKRGWKPTRQRK